MTPEERLTRIENVLQSLTDTQVQHAAQIEKQNAGIRDLIVVGRSLLDSVKELREAQATTDEKLNILIETVDRIIRSRENGKQ